MSNMYFRIVNCFNNYCLVAMVLFGSLKRIQVQISYYLMDVGEKMSNNVVTFVAIISKERFKLKYMIVYKYILYQGEKIRIRNQLIW